MTSPIEDFAVGGIAADFASKVQHTEYGGAAGLIQPEVAPDGSEGHSLEPAEIQAAQRRAGWVVARGVGGVGIDPGIVVDPASGRVITDDMSQDVSGVGGEFSDVAEKIGGQQVQP